LSEPQALLKHAFRLGALPVVSYSGPLLADLLTGSFVVENLFQIPGIGVFMVNSSLSRDYTMVVGLVLLYAVLVLVLNLMVDATYGLLDPRVRYELHRSSNPNRGSAGQSGAGASKPNSTGVAALPAEPNGGG